MYIKGDLVVNDYQPVDEDDVMEVMWVDPYDGYLSAHNKYSQNSFNLHEDDIRKVTGLDMMRWICTK